jgi:hypothetical protein
MGKFLAKHYVAPELKIWAVVIFSPFETGAGFNYSAWKPPAVVLCNKYTET